MADSSAKQLQTGVRHILERKDNMSLSTEKKTSIMEALVKLEPAYNLQTIGEMQQKWIEYAEKTDATDEDLQKVILNMFEKDKQWGIPEFFLEQTDNDVATAARAIVALLDEEEDTDTDTDTDGSDSGDGGDGGDGNTDGNDDNATV